MNSPGPPLRYEQLFEDSVASDEEMQKIKDLKDKTRFLVQNLWEAARDSDLLEETLSPVKQWFLNLISGIQIF